MPFTLPSLDFFANWASIISLIISGATLFVTSRIKSSVLRQVEKTDYMRDIDTQLTELRATYEALNDDQTPVNEKTIDLALRKLEVFPIRYGKILPKGVMKQISDVIEYFDKVFRLNIDSQKHRRNVASQMNKLILTLEKEKKIL